MRRRGCRCALVANHVVVDPLLCVPGVVSAGRLREVGLGAAELSRSVEGLVAF